MIYNSRSDSNSVEPGDTAESGNTVEPGHTVESSMSSRTYSISIARFGEFLRAMFALFLGMIRGENRKRVARPWHIFVSSREASGPALETDAKAHALKSRLEALGDHNRLAHFSAGMGTDESSFFADPSQIIRLIERILEENPPWLHLNRVLAGGEEGGSDHSKEYLYREQEVRERRQVELFIPDASWRDRPLSSLTLRPAKSISEVWQARLIDQILPPTILLDRCTRGEIMIPIRNPHKQRIEFQKEFRTIEVVTKQQVPIPIDIDGGGGKGGQLLYILLDFSASMRGSGAVVAMSVIVATLRAHLGQKGTKYLFRRYAQYDQLWPHRMDRPLIASTLEAKDRFLDTLLKTNFNGSATDVNDALTVAAKDIERLRQSESLEAEILLVTDGRAEMLEGTRLTLLRSAVKVHTVMVLSEPNPGLEALSESYTTFDIGPDQAVTEQSVRDQNLSAKTSHTTPTRVGAFKI